MTVIALVDLAKTQLELGKAARGDLMEVLVGVLDETGDTLTGVAENVASYVGIGAEDSRSRIPTRGALFLQNALDPLQAAEEPHPTHAPLLLATLRRCYCARNWCT